MRKRRMVGALFAALLAVAPAFAQSSSETSQTATASAVAVGGGGGSQAQATAGVFGTLFPGYPMANSEYKPYWNGPFAKVCPAEMESGRGKHDKVETKLVNPDATPGGNDCVTLLDWSPFGPVYYEDDREATITHAVGKEGEQPELTLLAGLYDARKHFHSDRCIAFIKVLNLGVTTGFSLGSGASGGMITSPGKNNDSVAFATGGFIGKTTTRAGEEPDFRIACLNKGSFTAPEPPKQSDNGSKEKQKKEEPAPTPPSPPPASVTPPPTPAPVPQAPPADACDITQLTIDYFFNQYDIAPDKTPIKDKYGAELKSEARWLINHSTCKVLTEGNASIEGTSDYNAVLARHRAKTVHDILVADGVPETQIKFASLGKDFPASDYQPENRRVILQVVGPASGK